MTDYTVNAQLLNCIPLSSGNDVGSKRQGRAAGSSNIWINKMRDYFVINVAWVSDDFNRRVNEQKFNRINAEALPWANRRNADMFAGFALPEIPIPAPGDFKQYPVQSRNMPGQTPNQGNIVINELNSESNTGTGYNDRLTQANYFTDVTPILFPSVQYEIIGHGSSITSRSPKGNQLVNGITPEIELI
jgi:hypothetical protein